MAPPKRTASSLSRRIKDGIRRARLEGKQIGSNGRRLAARNRALAAGQALQLIHVVGEFRACGASYREMVKRLNARAEPTPGGTGHWHVKTLQRLVDRTSHVHPLEARAEFALAQAQALRRMNQETVAQSESLLDRARALLDDAARTQHA